MVKNIILIGRSKSGKDEFYKIAKEAGYEFTRVSMADHLKSLTAKLFNITVEELEANKEKYRPFLIYGGNLAREISPSYWVDTAYGGIASRPYIVTDCRYFNELNYFDSREPRSNSNLVVCISSTKEVLVSRGYNEANAYHISENMIDRVISEGNFDAIILNNDTYEAYKFKVLEFLNKEYGLPQKNS